MDGKIEEANNDLKPINVESTLPFTESGVLKEENDSTQSIMDIV